MKNLTRFLSLVAVLAVASPAIAGKVTVRDGDTKNLPHCKGKVSLEVKSQGQYVKFKNVSQCSNVTIDGKTHKLGGKGQSRSGSVTIPKRLVRSGSNSIKLKLHSNSSKTWDDITAKFTKPSARGWITLGQVQKLTNCGGTIKITKSPASGGGEQLNVVIKNVHSGSVFEWEEINGKRGKTHKLQGKDGRRSASFTVSMKKLKWGANRALLTIRSNSGKTADKFQLEWRVVRR